MGIFSEDTNREMVELRRDAIDVLKKCPEEIYAIAIEVEKARQVYEEAQNTLKEAEMRHFLAADGKNAEARKAQVYEATKHLLDDVRCIEIKYRQKQLELERKNNIFRAYQYIARLLADD